MSKEEAAPAKLNLYQKLALITGEVGKVEKSGTSTGYGDKYNFIEFGAVAGRLRDLFAKYGVVVLTEMVERRSSEIVSKSGTKGVAVLVDFNFTVVNADDPADRFLTSWIGEAIDYGDKATNKASTVAMKFFLMRLFQISEKGDDPDGEVHEPPADRPAEKPAPSKPVLAGIKQKSKIFAQLRDLGFEGDLAKQIIYEACGIKSVSNELTVKKAEQLIDLLEASTTEKLNAFVTSRKLREKIDAGLAPQGDQPSAEEAAEIVGGKIVDDGGPSLGDDSESNKEGNPWES